MSIREFVAQELNTLGESELEQVAKYVSFLRFQSRLKPRQAWDETEIASLYAEFEKEDKELADAGINDFVLALAREDAQ